MEFLCLGIVKTKNEKEIFIAVLLKNLIFFIYDEFYTKNYKTIFFAQLHVSACPEMLEWSCLYNKEMDMYFCAQR